MTGRALRERRASAGPGLRGGRRRGAGAARPLLRDLRGAGGGARSRPSRPSPASSSASPTRRCSASVASAGSSRSAPRRRPTRPSRSTTPGSTSVVASGFEAGGHRTAFLAEAEDSLYGTLPLVRIAATEVARPGGRRRGHRRRAGHRRGARARRRGRADRDRLPRDGGVGRVARRTARSSSAPPRAAPADARVHRAAGPRRPQPPQRRARRRRRDRALPVPAPPARAAASGRPRAPGAPTSSPLWAGQGAPLLRHRRAAGAVRGAGRRARRAALDDMRRGAAEAVGSALTGGRSPAPVRYAPRRFVPAKERRVRCPSPPVRGVVRPARAVGPRRRHPAGARRARHAHGARGGDLGRGAARRRRPAGARAAGCWSTRPRGWWPTSWRAAPAGPSRSRRRWRSTATRPSRLVATYDALTASADRCIVIALTPDRKPPPAVLEATRRRAPQHPPPQLAARARLGAGAARARPAPRAPTCCCCARPSTSSRRASPSSTASRA